MKFNPITNDIAPIKRLSAQVKFDEFRSTNNFGAVMKTAMHNLNDVNLQAKEKIEDFVSGANPAIHDVMLTTEKAGMAMDLALQVRNKLVDAYNDIIRMQI